MDKRPVTGTTERPDGRGPVLLADRDGTLIRDVPYLSRLEEIVLLPGVLKALRLLNDRAIPVAIVTNQSGVARGVFTEDFVRASHARLEAIFRDGGVGVQGIYYCPHLDPSVRPADRDLPPSAYLRPCTCRKPAPGLLLDALADLGGDPLKSAMVGDADRDMAAAFAAGIPTAYRIPGSEEAQGVPGIAGLSRTGLLHAQSFLDAVQHFLDGL